MTGIWTRNRLTVCLGGLWLDILETFLWAKCGRRRFAKSRERSRAYPIHMENIIRNPCQLAESNVRVIIDFEMRQADLFTGVDDPASFIIAFMGFTTTPPRTGVDPPRSDNSERKEGENFMKFQSALQRPWKSTLTQLGILCFCLVCSLTVV